MNTIEYILTIYLQQLTQCVVWSHHPSPRSTYGRGSRLTDRRQGGASASYAARGHRVGVSERRACRVFSQARSTPRQRPVVPDDEPRLVARLIEVAAQDGRYGYRRSTGLLRGEGWTVHHKRLERLWRPEGLNVPQPQPKRGRLWLADGSCIRHRPEYRHHVWAYDFVADRTHYGRPLKILSIVEEYSRECLAIVVARWLRSIDVLKTLAELFVIHGVPVHIRSDYGPEFIGKSPIHHFIIAIKDVMRYHLISLYV